jgi:uncharacterized protein (DUF488 family)
MIYTIGHSSHPIEVFVELLRMHGVEVMADVRSVPASGYSPQFNRDPLRRALAAAGMRYSFLGKELGGRPEGAEFYDEDGRVRYYLVARAQIFNEAIERLEKAHGRYRIALMCGEEDPTGCHRTLLIGRVLHERGTDLAHIRGDGRLEPYAPPGAPARDGQLALFSPPLEETWRSVRSVLRASPRPNSSDS